MPRLRLRSRSDKIGIGFMIAWLVIWTAGMLVMLWAMGRAALAGEGRALLLMAVWLAAAGFGVWLGGRKLRRLLLHGSRSGGAPARNRRWDDGIPPRAQRSEPR